MISEQEIEAIGKAMAETFREKMAREEHDELVSRAFAKVDLWLTDHPRGHVEIIGDTNGRICHLIDFDAAAADQRASRTGFGQDTLSALLAALNEEGS